MDEACLACFFPLNDTPNITQFQWKLLEFPHLSLLAILFLTQHHPPPVAVRIDTPRLEPIAWLGSTWGTGGMCHVGHGWELLGSYVMTLHSVWNLVLYTVEVCWNHPSKSGADWHIMASMATLQWYEWYVFRKLSLAKKHSLWGPEASLLVFDVVKRGRCLKTANKEYIIWLCVKIKGTPNPLVDHNIKK